VSPDEECDRSLFSNSLCCEGYCIHILWNGPIKGRRILGATSSTKLTGLRKIIAELPYLFSRPVETTSLSHELH
jgi:hypothetical protein